MFKKYILMMTDYKSVTKEWRNLKVCFKILDILLESIHEFKV